MNIYTVMHLYNLAPVASYPSCTQELQYLEFFAGQANVWRAVSTKYAATRVDKSYEAFLEASYEPVPQKKMFQSGMDILTDCGFATLSSSIEALPNLFESLLQCGHVTPYEKCRIPIDHAFPPSHPSQDRDMASITEPSQGLLRPLCPGLQLLGEH